ncbi:MAG: sigma-54 interaction domain-containing protein [Eubacteriaceae bacterium]
MKNDKEEIPIQEGFYFLILESIFFCVFVNDASGKTIYTNPAVLRYYGKAPQELIETNSDWSTWEGIVFPPAYKELMKKKETVISRQENFITHNSYITINTPVMKKDSIDFMIQIIQESFEEHSPVKSTKVVGKSPNLISKNKAFKKMLGNIEKVANSDLTILLQGESGTGKTLIASHIHQISDRSSKPFRSINCGAIPSNLLESELFGYVHGAFTNANLKGKDGILKLADGGTVFLDEIGDMPLELQVKLLHVLENNTFMPVGSSKAIKVDVRFIAATNKNLLECIKKGVFRNDLYWRINSFTSTIPSLRQRREDIIPLAHHFLDQLNEKNKTMKTFHPLTLPSLAIYDWLGNVRELKNTVERMYTLTGGNIIYENHLPKEFNSLVDTFKKRPIFYNDIIAQAEEMIIQNVFKKYRTTTAVAEALGISQTRSQRLVNKYCIKRRLK